MTIMYRIMHQPVDVTLTVLKKNVAVRGYLHRYVVTIARISIY